jgi:hypothetical protein
VQQVDIRLEAATSPVDNAVKPLSAWPARAAPSTSLRVLKPWVLHSCGWTLAVLQVGLLIIAYHVGAWPTDRKGTPLNNLDFGTIYTSSELILHAQAPLIDDPAKFLQAEDTILGRGRALYGFWPYPPSILLVIAPLAMLPYAAALLVWESVTLLGYIAAVYGIARRWLVIPLVLASPFTLINCFYGNFAFLAASLLGAGLLFLERRPVLAGVFIGCLTFKPHWGILLPIALAASARWRAILAATVMAGLLAAVSSAVFGLDLWAALPRELALQADTNLSYHPEALGLRYDPREWWHLHQTVFGLVRTLHGSSTIAWFAQGISTFSVGLLVALFWRSSARYSLKAALLASSMLLATPYGFSTDMTVLAISLAFLAQDQIDNGMLRGEELLILATVAACLLHSSLGVPLAPFIMSILIYVILVRARHLPRSALVAVCP